MASRQRGQTQRHQAVSSAQDEQRHSTFDNALLGATHAVRQSSNAADDAVADGAVEKHGQTTTINQPHSEPAGHSSRDKPRQTMMEESLHRPSRANTLATPVRRDAPRAKSPSHAAALAATARAVAMRAEDGTTTKRQSTLPNANIRSRPPTATKPHRLSLQRSQSIDSPNDTSSIAPTTSLVNLFEQKSSTSKQQPPPPRSPKPSLETLPSPDTHPSPDGLRSLLQNEVGLAQRGQDVPQAASKTSPRQKNVLEMVESTGGLGQEREHRSGTDNGSADRVRNKCQSSILPTEDARRQRNDGSVGAKAGSPRRQIGAAVDIPSRGRQGGQDNSVRTTAQDSLKSSQTKAPALPPRITVAKPKRADSLDPPSTRSDLFPTISRTATAPISIQPRKQPPAEPFSTSAQSSQSVNATYRQLYPARHVTTLTNGDELANAIVASSLASSRLSSPQRREPPPLPPSRRHSKHGRSIFHSRTPSPSKAGLRQTLRKQDSSSSEEEDAAHPYSKHHKRRLIRKHPNKHHEGDRKRWRDAVTETERKRYEGVWAANKSLFLPHLSSDPGRRGDSAADKDQVSNIVTREIWGRSRLPDYELEAIWDLVDSENTGRLSKEEFVVGMWLIDQRLKGRKVPVKVTATVWASVKNLHGIKVRK